MGLVDGGMLVCLVMGLGYDLGYRLVEKYYVREGASVWLKSREVKSLVDKYGYLLSGVEEYRVWLGSAGVS